jgi:hypothetical protein
VGLTYIQETAERFQDERWHIAYADKLPLYDPTLTQFVCVRCALNFSKRDELEDHQKVEHNFLPPLLLVAGKPQPFLVLFKKNEQFRSIELLNVKEVRILKGGKWDALHADQLKDHRFWSDQKRAEIKLIGGNNEEARHLIKFEEVNEEEIEFISKEFQSSFAKDGEFSWNQIIDFERSNQGGGAQKFRRALANYLRGIKFRDKQFEAKSAKPESYKEAFNYAYSELKFYDTSLARIIVGLVNLSKSDFSIRRPTGVVKLDFLLSSFFELKEFGDSSRTGNFSGADGLPITPTDKSIEMLLSLVDVDNSSDFEKIFEMAQKNNEALQNESVLAKILYLWMFNDDDSGFRSKIFTEFSHNTTFQEFLNARKSDDK